MRKIFYWVLVIAFLAALFLIPIHKKDAPVVQQENLPPAGLVIKQVKIAGISLDVELALTQAEQERGLSGRTELKENQSMLFVFNNPGKYSFWMKDMNFPIDMIWIAEDMTVIYIKKDARPESYPEAFTPEKDAKYVLETASGFSEKNNLKVGDRVEFAY